MSGCANDSACVSGGSGWATRSPLCDGCLDVVGRDVRALVLDYRDLAQLLAPGAKARPVVSGTTDAAVPLDLGVDTLMRDIAWTLAVWEPPVREAAGLCPERVRGVRAGWAVATAVSVLAARIELLAGLPPTWGYADGLDAGPVERDGVYAAASMRALHRRARSALGLSRLVVRLPGPCSTCGATWLQRDPGEDGARCPVCNASWSGDDYAKYVGLQLAARRERAA